MVVVTTVEFKLSLLWYKEEVIATKYAIRTITQLIWFLNFMLFKSSKCLLNGLGLIKRVAPRVPLSFLFPMEKYLKNTSYNENKENQVNMNQTTIKLKIKQWEQNGIYLTYTMK